MVVVGVQTSTPPRSRKGCWFLVKRTLGMCVVGMCVCVCTFFFVFSFLVGFQRFRFSFFFLGVTLKKKESARVFLFFHHEAMRT